MQPRPQQPPGKDTRFVKHSAVDGLLRGFGIGNGSAELTEVVQLVGGKGGLPTEVPVERYVALLDWLARRYYPGQKRSEALRSVGIRMFLGYRQTLLGQIQLKALNLAGPERLMKKLGDYLGRNSNFGERSSQELGPRHWRLLFKSVPVPAEFYQGLSEAAFDVMGIKKMTMTFEKKGPEDTEFDIRWEA